MANMSSKTLGLSFQTPYHSFQTLQQNAVVNHYQLMDLATNFQNFQKWGCQTSRTFHKHFC